MMIAWWPEPYSAGKNGQVRAFKPLADERCIIFRLAIETLLSVLNDGHASFGVPRRHLHRWRVGNSCRRRKSPSPSPHTHKNMNE